MGSCLVTILPISELMSEHVTTQLYLTYVSACTPSIILVAKWSHNVGTFRPFRPIFPEIIGSTRRWQVDHLVFTRSPTQKNLLTALRPVWGSSPLLASALTPSIILVPKMTCFGSHFRPFVPIFPKKDKISACSPEYTTLHTYDGYRWAPNPADR